MKLKLLIAALDSEQHHSHALHDKVQAMAKKPQFRPA
jgi:hypothetical protein